MAASIATTRAKSTECVKMRDTLFIKVNDKKEAGIDLASGLQKFSSTKLNS